MLRKGGLPEARTKRAPGRRGGDPEGSKRQLGPGGRHDASTVLKGA
jgi:hypothetical protein